MTVVCGRMDFACGEELEHTLCKSIKLIDWNGFGGWCLVVAFSFQGQTISYKRQWGDISILSVRILWRIIGHYMYMYGCRIFCEWKGGCGGRSEDFRVLKTTLTQHRVSRPWMYMRSCLFDYFDVCIVLLLLVSYTCIVVRTT